MRNETTEREVVKKLLKECELIDPSFESRRVKWSSRKGAPDLLLCFPSFNYSAFAETKRPRGGIISPHQSAEHKILRASGQRVFIIANLNDVDDFSDHFHKNVWER